jgi:predicted nucleotidyltransferase component of viral defense system
MTKSKTHKMAITIQEIKRLVIIALASDDQLMETLVLKGGNAIELLQTVSGKLSRASYDLDFSMADDFDNELEEISGRIKKTLSQTFSENGLVVIDFKFASKPSSIGAALKDFWGGYNIEFKLITPEQLAKATGDTKKLSGQAIPMFPGGSSRIEVEISKYEFVEGKKEMDVDGYTMYIYSPEMIVFEKVRAICQQLPEYRDIIPSHAPRPRARDFYDIHLIMTQHKIDPATQENKQLLTNIFAAKRVPLAFIQRIKDNLEIHRLDWQSVLDTLSAKEDVKDFDFYVSYTVEHFRPLTFP